MINPTRMSTNVMCFGRTQAVALTITSSWHWLYMLTVFAPNLLLNYMYFKCIYFFAFKTDAMKIYTSLIFLYKHTVNLRK